MNRLFERGTVRHTHSRGRSLYGAPWLQPVAIVGKSTTRGSRRNKPKPLPSFATGCAREYMVRRGSTVRVRKRASRSSCCSAPFRCERDDGCEKRALLPDLRDLFLCHAWDDRRGPAKELHDLLESLGVSVWFSEKDVVLGSPLLRKSTRDWRSHESGSCL